MDTKDIIAAIMQREGWDKETNDPLDSGGRTKFGIAEASHPEAWADGDVTQKEAEDIYFEKYVHPFRLVTDLHLLHQLVDWGVTSGPVTVARMFQQLVGAPVDGQIGPRTVAAIEAYPGGTLFGNVVPGAVLLNLAVQQARALHYAGIAKRRPKDLRFLLGWLNRTFEFK
jgi:lysozyme family protein